MAITPIVVRDGGFQTSLVFTEIDTVAQPITEEMSFVNDGYSVLFIWNPFPPGIGEENDILVSVTQIEDNAGRGNVYEAVVPHAGYGSFGPYRPIWWNSGGIVNVNFTFAATGGLEVLADARVWVTKFQF